MALREQPYFPLYVQDFLTDEKLNECSAESAGVYIRLMCIMHKSQTYGSILLKQKDKQTGDQISDFALKLTRQMPYDATTIGRSLTELLDEGVLSLEGDMLFQKRMVKDGKISDAKAFAGKKGAEKKRERASAEVLACDFAGAEAEANRKQNTEYENEIEIESEHEIEHEAETDSSGGAGGDCASPVIVLPLKTGGGYPVSAEQCHEWADLYPAVDVMQQLRSMKGWLNSNPGKRKTARGTPRFINGWLMREQNRASPSRGGSSRTAEAMDDLRELHRMFDEEEQP